jgi:MYXO-CTERM domain-containing protein
MRFQPAFSSGTQNERCILSNYRKILRTGILMSGLIVTGVVMPAAAQTAADQGTTTDRHDRGFDSWGLLGLLGLAGLVGRKRERNVVEARRI